MMRPSKESIPLPGFRWRGLNLQFFALILLPLTGVLLLITFGSLKLHQDAMRTLVGERDERAARTAAGALNEQLDYRAVGVRGLALQGAERADLSRILATADFLQPYFDFGLAFFSPGGELLNYSGDESLWNDLPPDFHIFLESTQAQAGVQAFFSSVLPHPNLDDNLVLVAYTVTDDSPLAVGAFSPATLAQRTLIGTYFPGEDSAVFLVAPDRQIIYQIGDFSPFESLENHPGIDEALRGKSGTTYEPVDGGEHVIAFSAVSSTGWALVIEEPWDAVTNTLLNATQLAPLVLVPVLLLTLAALWFGARKIIQPLQALETKAVDLAWGDHMTIKEPVGGIEEIRRLQRTLSHLSEKIQQAQAGLHDYIGAITTGQEDERQRLARDLHDDTIQAMIALNQRVQLAQLKLAEDPEAIAAFDEIKDLTEQTIKNLRRVVKDLRPIYLEDLGLVAALKMLAQETAESSGIRIEFSDTGIEKRLSPEKELALYRIAQEGLRNIQRHAEASTASLIIAFTSDQIQLTITDDGCGFNIPESPAELAVKGHFGLLGIQERTELIGARFEIRSGVEDGTSLQVTIPV